MSEVPGTSYLIINKKRGSVHKRAWHGLARAVGPGIPHHVTQLGNRRHRTLL